MANSNDFQVILQAVLDSSGIGKSDIAEVQKVIEKYHLNLTADLNKAELIKTVKTVLSEIKADHPNINIDINDKEVEKAVNQIVKDQQRLQKELSKTASESQRLSKMNTIKAWADNNSKAMKLFGGNINGIIDKMNRIDLPDEEFRRLNAEFEKIKISAREAGVLGKTFGDSFKDMGSKFFSWVSVSGLIMTGANSLRKMKDEVIALDNSLLELSKVSDLTVKGLQDITSEAFVLGETVGKTGTQVIDAISEFKRAGYEISDSMEMAKSALIMTNVAEGITDTADAAGTLIAALKGFKMPESDIMSIVDSMNSVSNKSPINFDNLAEGLERISGTMYQAGNSIHETLGLITGGFAQLRNVEKVSSGLVTIGMRLRGVGEDGEAIEGLSAKLKNSFGEIGVSIEDANGNLRSTTDIMRDYAAVLPTLSSKQKQFYGELAAGKRQITVWDAITSSIDDVDKAINQSINSVGSSNEENTKYLESIQGRVSQLESAFQLLSNTIIDSDLIKYFVDLGTTGVSALDGIISAMKDVSSLFGGGNSLGGMLGALSGLLMNRTGMGKYCTVPLYI